MLHIFHHVGYGLKCLTIIVVGEDGVLAQFTDNEVPIQTAAYDID